MKAIISLITTITILSVSTLLGQDLIEKVRLGIPLEQANNTKNKLYDLVQNTRSTQSRSQAIELFSLEPTPPISQEESEELTLSDVVFLELNIENLRTLRTQRSTYVTVSIPIDKEAAIELELVLSDFKSANYTAYTSSGTVLETDGVFYRGIIKGLPNSTVALSLFDKEVRGLILDEDGNYNLGKLKDKEAYGFFNDMNLKSGTAFQCDTEESDFSQELETTILPPTDHSRLAALLVQVYIECDYQMYQDFENDRNAVANFANGLFNEMSAIYYNEGLTPQISQLKIWDTKDPYADVAGTTQAILDAFQANVPSFNGDMAHLLSTRIGGGRAVRSSTLCRNSSNPLHAVTSSTSTEYKPYPIYSSWVKIATHEMGHNLGSPHTHSCLWGPNNNLAIDNCVSISCALVKDPTPTKDLATIMSYCNSGTIGTVYLTRGFGTEPGQLIRDRVAAAASCLDACAVVPLADFLNPQVACTGASMIFNSLSSCTDSRTWTFTGGMPATSQELRPNITYTTPGTHTASISATNAIGNASKSKYVYIQNAPAGVSNISESPSVGGGVRGITSFSLANVKRVSENSTVTKYEDFACTDIILLKPNTTYSPLLWLGDTCQGGPHFEKVIAYIDYNGDGDFIDANEEVAVSGVRCGIFSYTFTTPSNPAMNKLLRMRFITDESTKSISSPDYVPIFGQVEDYSLFFHDGATPLPSGEDFGDGICRNPINLTNNMMPGSKGIFRAARTIQTDGNVVEVAAGEDVSLLAGESITLLPGFSAQAGSNFLAKIESCTPALAPVVEELAHVSRREEITKKSAFQEKTNHKNLSLKIQPNPFQATTNFSFSLAQSEAVSMAIYDLNGGFLEQILVKKMLPKGQHQISYTPKHLDTGIFYVSIQTDSSIQTQKMIVLSR